MRMKSKFAIGLMYLVGVLSPLLVPSQAQATTLTVGCPSGGAFTSIQAAVNAAAPGDVISVTGTCTESVGLFNARNIAIVASAPGAATVIGLQDSDVFDIGMSQGIVLQNLEIRGNAASSFGGGVAIFTNSQVTIVGCNIHDNKDVGVAADSKSMVSIGDLSTPTTIHDNVPGDGLDVTNDSSADVIATTIQNNGLAVTGGVGVFVQNRSSVVFRRQNSILNNGDVGIFATDLCRIVFQAGNPSQFTTISGHNVDGILAVAQSVVRMNGGPHAIQSNGSACPTDPTCGGIFGLRNSTLRLNAGNISGNQGSGIDVEQGVDLALFNMTISNNSGDGVHLQRISIGEFDTPNTISGNGGASVFCDSTSLATGDLSTFSKPACKNIERSNGKVHPGKAKEPTP